MMKMWSSFVSRLDCTNIKKSATSVQFPSAGRKNVNVSEGSAHRLCRMARLVLKRKWPATYQLVFERSVQLGSDGRWKCGLTAAVVPVAKLGNENYMARLFFGLVPGASWLLSYLPLHALKASTGYNAPCNRWAFRWSVALLWHLCLLLCEPHAKFCKWAFWHIIVVQNEAVELTLGVLWMWQYEWPWMYALGV